MRRGSHGQGFESRASAQLAAPLLWHLSPSISSEAPPSSANACSNTFIQQSSTCQHVSASTPRTCAIPYSPPASYMASKVKWALARRGKQVPVDGAWACWKRPIASRRRALQLWACSRTRAVQIRLLADPGIPGIFLGAVPGMRKCGILLTAVFV